MTTITTHKTKILTDSDADLRLAADLLKDGKLVAFPTETVYGLGGNALLSDAARRIYEAKGRPQDNPLIIHLADPAEADHYCVTNALFHLLAKAFMPGPITVILPKRDCIPYTVTGGLDTVAVRIPSHPIANRMLRFAGIPVAAPSANLSGKPSPTTAQHVMHDLLGRIDAIVDGGACEIGVESTIVKIDDGTVTLLRPGAITYEMLCALCGDVKVDPSILQKTEGRPLAPGMRYRHYAPHMPVTMLDGTDQAFYHFLQTKPLAGVICYDEDLPHLKNHVTYSLGAREDSASHARNLFECLREMDARSDLSEVYARVPAKDHLGLAVWNRLSKAAGFHVLQLNQEENNGEKA
mgnify:CR=1 FL=1